MCPFRTSPQNADDHSAICVTVNVESKTSPPNTTDTESEGEEHHEAGFRNTMVLKVCKTYHGNLTLLPAAKKNYFSQSVPDLCVQVHSQPHVSVLLVEVSYTYLYILPKGCWDDFFY